MSDWNIFKYEVYAAAKTSYLSPNKITKSGLNLSKNLFNSFTLEIISNISFKLVF